MIDLFRTLPGQLLNVVRDVNPGWYLLGIVVLLGALAVWMIWSAP